ncbi:MAG: amidohydrolase family protein [Phycisphaerales bacterium]|nr:amidohydrolase family protein [Phycisphaerales bacterium]
MIMPRRLRSTLGPLAVAATITASAAHAQVGPVNGMRPVELRAHAITDVTAIIAPGESIEHATIVIRDGIIEAVGADVVPPKDAWVRPGRGDTVYAGFIEPALLVDPGAFDPGPGGHWHSRVTPQLHIAATDSPDARTREELRKLGFAVAAVYPSRGLLRGTGSVVALAEETEHVVAYADHPAMAAAFDFGGGRRGGGGGASDASSYPGSLMGAIALMRQTLADARWDTACRAIHASNPVGLEPPSRADALIALAPVVRGEMPLLFDVRSDLDLLRAHRVVDEYEVNAIMLGSGQEYRRLNEVVATGWPLIIPLDFPKAPSISTLADADRTTLETLMSWEQSPTNPRRLIDAGATVATTTHRLRSRADFLPNLRAAVKHGLSEADALASITTTPAAMLGLDAVLGTIAPGKAANLVVVEGSIFDAKATIRDVWVNGRRHEIEARPTHEYIHDGLLVTSTGLTLPVRVDTKKTSVVLHPAEGKPVTAKKTVVQAERVSFTVGGDLLQADGLAQFSGVITGDVITGGGAMPDGSRFTFSITRDDTLDLAAKTPKGRGDGRRGDDAGDANGEPGDDGEPNGRHAEADDDDDDVSVDPTTTGVWRAIVATDDMPPFEVVLTLDEAPDHTIGGTVEVEMLQLTTPIDSGRRDADSNAVTLNLVGPDGSPATIEATLAGNAMRGTVTTPGGAIDLNARREGGDPPSADGGERAEAPFVMPPDTYPTPLGAFGLDAPPAPQTVAVIGATIWTSGPQGIIEHGALLVENGRIAFVGPAAGFSAPAGALVVDGAGKHVTPGLIDCHSHTGISSGVNEFGQTITAEVRIGDVVNPDDIDWYRQLAGGLTAVNQLHGSANPIGGQNSVVKIRWGGTVDDFRIPDAIGGIKFALGENVTRSEGRYPNTRMGVETMMRDAFTAAREYEAALQRWSSASESERRCAYPPRPDLELDALVEILDGERLVHCHSYRQDEILMLIRLAEDFGFTIGTFQHVLEGYKVADAIAAHGAGASSFSDWWAYKVEVMDAIPFNGAILHDVGAVVSFNSDSDELARRMNTEAAKAVRYGGVEPSEALKFVTINPARQLRVDHRIGSLEVGKDGDFAIWSGDPLSTYTICEQTWVDGARAFDRDADLAMRTHVQTERQRLIQKVLAAGGGGAGGERGRGGGRPADVDRELDRDDAEAVAAYQAWVDQQLRSGHDPTATHPGECGCNDWWLAFQRARTGERE